MVSFGNAKGTHLDPRKRDVLPYLPFISDALLQKRNEMQDASPQIEIRPQASLVDEPVHIRVTGFPAEHPVLLRAQLPTRFGSLESFALLQTDGTGCIDVARALPLRGTYAMADPMGLFWSMTRVESTSDNLHESSNRIHPAS